MACSLGNTNTSVSINSVKGLWGEIFLQPFLTVWIQSTWVAILYGLALHCEQDISEAISVIKSHCLCQLC